jgi:Glucodextranase, domain B
VPTTAPLPLPARLLLLGGLILLGAVILGAGSGALGRVAASLGGTVGDLVGGILTTVATTPSPTVAPALVPRLDAPRSRYTNQKTYTLTGHLPSSVLGTPDSTVRIYDNGHLVVAVPITTTADFSVPELPLVEGDNELTAAIAIAGREDEPSDPISVVLDTTAPTITLSSPKNGLTVTANTVTVAGSTKANATVTIQNVNSGGTTSVIADSKGAFHVDMTLISGSNDLTITVTDQAGNTASKSVTVKHSGGGVSASLNLSSRTVSGSNPKALTLTVTVRDSKGHAVTGGTVVFSVAPPNQGALVSDPIPIAAGTASWTVTLAQQAQGSGQIVVDVQLPDGSSTTVLGSFTVGP